MTPVYLSSHPDSSSFPLFDIRGEDDLHDYQLQSTHHQQVKIFFSSSTHNKEASTATTPYLPCPIHRHHHQEPRGTQATQPLINDLSQVVKDQNLYPYGHSGSVSASDHSTTCEEGQGISILLPSSGQNSDQEINSRQTDGNGILGIRWMSSKMRKSSPNSRASRWSVGGDLVKQSQDFEYLQEVTYLGRSNLSVKNGAVRVCSDCNTTTTPLWRSGPRGPKSLCNACGIRQRKARRAMEAAAAAYSCVANTTSADTSTSRTNKNNNWKPHNKMMDKKPRTNKKCSNKFKKHTTNSDPHHEAGKKKQNGLFENFTIGLSETSSSSGFGRVFPGDEAEAAALLLMEISRSLFTS